MMTIPFLLLFVSGILAKEDNYIINELPCIIANGECMKTQDCPVGVRSLGGYCPRQEESGIGCCLSTTMSCRSRGGECVKFDCPKRLTFDKSNDCSEDETCCILVN